MSPRRARPAYALGRALSIAALTALFMAAGMTAAEAKRLALVVGNSAYAAAPALRNAVPDAEAVATALQGVGFEVTLLKDVTSADFWARVDAFAAAAQDADSTLFYYSGHAFQMSGVNYLVPVDARLDSRDALRSETWNLDGIIARLQDRKRQTLVFLDACRNDPVPAGVRGSAASSGLARIQTGVGTFVAFATEPGGVAYDGAPDAAHSPFTEALLKNLEQPGLSVSDMMIKVRNDVEAATQGAQTPWDQSSLREQFYFKAPTEAKQELTEADYELLAQLSPEDRAQFLELLRQSGFSEESLRQADDAITVASFNLEVAAESEVIIGAAPVGAAPAPVETAPEIDLASLETVEGGGTVVGVGAAPVEVAAAAPAEVAPAEVAVVEPAPVEPAPVEPAPVEVAAADPAPAAPVAEAPAPVEVAAADPAPALPGTADLPAPAPSESVAAIPETVVAALPEDQTAPALGSPVTDQPPVRLAALTWQTRAVELNPVGGERARLSAQEILPDTDVNREILAAIDPALLQDGPAAAVENVALAVQGELARVGCYRITVDGDWGRGSRTALTSYFLAKKTVPTSLEPTPALLQQLQAETQVVCQQVARAKVVPGKTKQIIPVAAAQEQRTRNPTTGRTVVTREERKTEIKKGLLGSGSF